MDNEVSQERFNNALHRAKGSLYLLTAARAVEAMTVELAQTDLEVKAEIVGLSIELKSLADKIEASLQADKEALGGFDA